jgi:hypothetical protein
MDSEIIKFLQLPPHTPFESELGTQIFVSGLAARARDARNAPNLLTGDGDSHLGAGKAIPPIDPNPKIFCALIIAELWHFLHGSFPKTAKNALGAATSYWAAKSMAQTQYVSFSNIMSSPAPVFRRPGTPYRFIPPPASQR